ncbi:MAG: TolC family protein [Deltaproteobacteria bacterium]|nr:TolC family protein [Deltaproteobacteria bacterium]
MKATPGHRPAYGKGGWIAGPALALVCALVAARAAAQPEATAPAPPPAAEQAPAEDALATVLRPVPGGLGLERVAELAVKQSFGVAAKQAELRAAAAKVDQAFVAYFPVATLSAMYTRLSEVESGFKIEMPAIPGLDLSAFDFPIITNSYSLVASLAVPVSDYLLRLTQSYAAASEAAEAKRLEARAEALGVAADAKVAFLNWVRAKGQGAVAELAVDQTEAHLRDARAASAAGLLASADVLRLEAQLEQTRHLARSAGAFQQLAAEQLRTVLHLAPEAPLGLGLDVMHAGAGPEQQPLAELQRTALAQRLELGAMDATRRSLAEVQAVTRAGYFPRLDGFANFTLANPNQRYFPQAEEWNGSWEAGARLSWTINETFATRGRSAQARATVQAIEQQAAALRDGIRMSVAAAYYDAARARSAISAAERSEQAAVESLRARRLLRRAGKATSTDIIDADTTLTRTRLQRIDAHIDLLVARTRLEHAVGAGGGG